jgi:hypothetical protein
VLGERADGGWRGACRIRMGGARGGGAARGGIDAGCVSNSGHHPVRHPEREPGKRSSVQALSPMPASARVLWVEADAASRESSPGSVRARGVLAARGSRKSGFAPGDVIPASARFESWLPPRAAKALWALSKSVSSGLYLGKRPSSCPSPPGRRDAITSAADIMAKQWASLPFAAAASQTLRQAMLFRRARALSRGCCPAQRRLSGLYWNL